MILRDKKTSISVTLYIAGNIEKLLKLFLVKFLTFSDFSSNYTS